VADNPPGTILVTGATGNVGRHVVSELAKAGADVRALTRSPDAAGLPAGVDVARGDLFRPATVAATLEGVDSVFLLWPATTLDGAAEIVELIASHARRIVYLSAMAAGDQQDGQPEGFWAGVERLIRRTSLEWTFLRPTGFAANALMWADQIRSAGVVRWPYGAATRSLIHERDIAAVAVRALTGDEHAGAKYVLTGPQVLTQVQQVHAIGEAIGRPVRWEELSPEIARKELLAAWGDAAFVDIALGSWADMVTAPEPVTSTVEEVTGVPARTFGEWAADHADAFR
jgi:uncharacterized protein YbjT (DUF2867 family)